ncbi:MAG: nicotinamide-nucleotide amidohydrolase family protein [Oscillospiraceae bacterium]|nr:nicotinamide-nucleotide amidohydrolase family protein [Oscillospiraceae bacterium]
MNTPERELFSLLLERGLTLSAAESCTGGLIAKRMTDLPGASKVFCGGVVSYWSEVKASVLGVPQAAIDEFGAVSEPVARAMAEGVRRITNSSLGVSVTGVAGPDADDRGNAVGTVYIAAADETETVCRLFSVGALSRGEIREKAADAAFILATELLNKKKA